MKLNVLAVTKLKSHEHDVGLIAEVLKLSFHHCNAGFGEIVVSEMSTLVSQDTIVILKHCLGNADT